MTDAQRHYLAVEMGIGAAINAVLSIVFGMLVFHGQAMVPAPALVSDTIPQSFMVTLMSVLVPTLLTRARVRAGSIAPLPTTGWPLPRLLLLRAPLMALVAALVAWLAHRTLLPALLPHGAPFWPMLVAKTLYGAVLGAAVTWLSVRQALADPAGGVRA